MTDEAHLALIAEHGLLSSRAREELGIIPAYPGGSELTRMLDAENGFDDKIFLSFSKMRVMPKHDDARYRRPVHLKINASVLLLQGVKIALGLANRQRSDLYTAADAFYKMDWEVISGEVNETNVSIHERWRIFKVLNYEALVPRRIPVEYVVGVA